MRTAAILTTGVMLLGMVANARGVILTFDDLVQGEIAYNFDGNGDGVADVTFSTTDPAGFNTLGPGSNMTYIQEPGLEGTSLLSQDLRVDFLRGVRGNVSFGFALDSYSEDDTATFRVYDAVGTPLASHTETGRYTATPAGTSNFPEGRMSLNFPGTASYGTFDFTSDFGRYIIDNVEGVAPEVYGVFVGVKDTEAVRGDLDAAHLYNTFSQNLPGFKEGVLLTADMKDGGVTNAQIRKAIDSLAVKASPGDKFIFYSSSHGGTSYSGTETTLTAGDEWLALGQDLVDDDFRDYFSELNQVEKWVLLDECHSGGFWGNDNARDHGDLEKLDNICLFAAADEDRFAYADKNGLGYFGRAIIDAFTVGKNGFLVADADKNYDVTFAELTNWVQNYATESFMDGTVVFQKDLGDPVLFTSDMWSAMSIASPGFGGSLFGGELPPAGPQPAVPVPGAALLGIMGTSLLTWLRRRQAI